MPRYVVERTFADACRSRPTSRAPRPAWPLSSEGVTWVHSYVTDDRSKTFCVYDGPNPEAIRGAAERNGLPVDRISEVRVLDPYFHH